MRLRRTLLIIVAVLTIAFGALALPWHTGGGNDAKAAACAICGDGVCAKSCENKYSCPRDCGGGGSTSKTASSGQAR
jgi:hypothetical protein